MGRRPPGRRVPVSCPPGIEVRLVRGKGRGVFATRRFQRGEVVERSPVIPMTAREWRHLARTVLGDYAYAWGRGGCSMVLGVGSLVNHSCEPTVENFNRGDLAAMDWVALRDIAPGEEITVNYNESDAPRRPLWFSRQRRGR